MIIASVPRRKTTRLITGGNVRRHASHVRSQTVFKFVKHFDGDSGPGTGWLDDPFGPVETVPFTLPGKHSSMTTRLPSEGWVRYDTVSK